MKIFVHIGYQKTGTSTLQSYLFDYLGDEFNYLKIEDSSNNKNNYGRSRMFHKVIFDSENVLRDFYLKLEEKKINLISNEDLSLPNHFKKFRKGDDSYVSDYSSVIKIKCKAILEFYKKFEPKYKIIVAIRNQRDYIYSMYVEATKTINLPDINNFHFENERFKKSLFPEYYYCDTLNEYSNHFGKENIEVVLFEDLIKDKEYYFERWAEILGIDKMFVKKQLELKHSNMKEKTDTGYIAEVSKPKLMFRIYKTLRRFKFFTLLINQIKKFKMMQLLESKLRKKKVEKKLIPFFNAEQKKEIFDTFKESNQKLVTEWGLDEEKLRNYGYID